MHISVQVIRCYETSRVMTSVASFAQPISIVTGTLSKCIRMPGRLDSVSYTTGSCKMMFAISYLVTA